jgi:methyltransferase (TIGR00027 family)
MTQATIRHVSDTALWVAMYRALESERPDALFHDPYARKMAGERGEAIVRTMPRARSMGWPMVVRTQVMDEIVLRSCGSGLRTVLNLAAGLDARAFRLDLPASLLWIDVDLPDMIAYRREHLGDAKPRCRHQHLAADLANPESLDEILDRARDWEPPVLAVTEGLLVYLTSDQVTALATRLHREPGIASWLTDLASPLLLDMLKRSWQPSLSAAGAPLQFAPPEGTAFFAPLGWREAEFRSTWDESLRLRRSVPLASVWQLVSRLRPKEVRARYRRMSGIVLLERR